MESVEKSGNSVPMYRLYNPNGGEHFYTGNTYERDNLKSKGWRYEGIGWQAPTTGNKTYRLYNRNSGEHFYTTDAAERDRVKRAGWRDEGISWYSQSGGTPVYRLFNPNTRGAGSHHYTLNTYERDNLKSKGWRYEGVAWYAASGNPTPSDEKVLNVPVVWQGDTMLCEGSSLLAALRYKGDTNKDLYSFVNSMPMASDGNPYHGYSGEWRYNVNGTYQGMMADPVVTWAQKNGGNAVNISGKGTGTLKSEIRNGNPVVTWITYNYASPEFKQMPWGRAVWNGHVVLVDGFRDGGYHVVDPVFGAKWIGSGTFENAFNVTGMAVSVR
ncbi:C39 family peptidase [Enterococcus gilvus]|uniref:C39 family peptidase n=1 Tax=Enterococcus gilvus TaxID=160453 RepID=UPI001C8B1563|nr:glycosyhydrolase [Enterococcus gilvus]